jgi:hypothetical protein
MLLLSRCRSHGAHFCSNSRSGTEVNQRVIKLVLRSWWRLVCRISVVRMIGYHRSEQRASMLNCVWRRGQYKQRHTEHTVSRTPHQCASSVALVEAVLLYGSQDIIDLAINGYDLPVLSEALGLPLSHLSIFELRELSLTRLVPGTDQ